MATNDVICCLRQIDHNLISSSCAEKCAELGFNLVNIISVWVVLSVQRSSVQSPIPVLLWYALKIVRIYIRQTRVCEWTSRLRSDVINATGSDWSECIITYSIVHAFIHKCCLRAGFCVVNEGRFSSVYKATSKSGKEVAIEIVSIFCTRFMYAGTLRCIWIDSLGKTLSLQLCTQELFALIFCICSKSSIYKLASTTKTPSTS